MCSHSSLLPALCVCACLRGELAAETKPKTDLTRRKQKKKTERERWKKVALFLSFPEPRGMGWNKWLGVTGRKTTCVADSSGSYWPEGPADLQPLEIFHKVSSWSSVSLILEGKVPPQSLPCSPAHVTLLLVQPQVSWARLLHPKKISGYICWGTCKYQSSLERVLRLQSKAGLESGSLLLMALSCRISLSTVLTFTGRQKRSRRFLHVLPWNGATLQDGRWAPAEYLVQFLANTACVQMYLMACRFLWEYIL